jgi:hypothetical protein
VALAPNPATSGGLEGGPTGSGSRAGGVFAADLGGVAGGAKLLGDVAVVIEAIKATFEPATRVPEDVGNDPMGKAFKAVVPGLVEDFEAVLDAMKTAFMQQSSQTGELLGSLHSTDAAATATASPSRR